MRLFLFLFFSILLTLESLPVYSQGKQLNYKPSILVDSLISVEIKDTLKVMRLIEKALAEDQNNPDLIYYRGYLNFSSHKYTLAIFDLDKVLLQFPDNYTALITKGNIYREMGKSDLALSNYEKATQTTDTASVAYVDKGDLEIELNRLVDALKDLKIAARIRPSYTQMLHLGLGYEAMNQYDSAIACYKKALIFKPKGGDALNNLGTCFTVLRKYQEAVDYFTATISAGYGFSDVFYNRGNAYRLLTRYPDAIKDFDVAIKLDPEDAKAHNDRGFCEENLKQMDLAEIDFSLAIKYRPNYSLALCNRGILRTQKGMNKEALEDFNEAIKCNKANLVAYRNRGCLRKNTGDLNGGIDDFSFVLEKVPSDCDSYLNRAQTYYMMKNIKMACKDLEAAKRFDSCQETAKGLLLQICK